MKLLAVFVAVLAVGTINAAPGGLLGGLLGGDLLKGTVTGVTDSLKNVLGLVLQSIIEIVSSVLNVLEQLSLAVGNVTGLLTELMPTVAGALNGITDILDKTGLPEILPLKGLISSVNGTLQELIENVIYILNVDDLSKVLDELLSKVEVLVKKIVCDVFNIIANLAEIVDKLIEEATAAVEKIICTVQATLDKLVEVVYKVLNQLVATLAQNLPRKLSGLLINIVRTLRQTVRQLDGVTDELLTNVKVSLKSLSYELRKILKGLAGSIGHLCN
ncbi:hypothetical protein Bhyg_14167 [Pseudolycoriella hygida]|uniref:Uncharacterized protein n=1 Tax=Pseudolycoriella hygida TaxID=35572 RepID=A0A9Q0MPP9_9DIPT|nr:hypothetical protein Bhyg_14167 [Pseudolycoriella hygida]